MQALPLNRFGDRVVFSGNLNKNDLSITLSDVQLEDEGIYNCYVNNPPDRILGHGVIRFSVVTERKMSTLLFANTKEVTLFKLKALFLDGLLHFCIAFKSVKKKTETQKCF